MHSLTILSLALRLRIIAESENLASLKEAGKAFVRRDVEARGVLTNAANRKNASETTKDQPRQ